jgi:hypothetical protein
MSRLCPAANISDSVAKPPISTPARDRDLWLRVRKLVCWWLFVAVTAAQRRAHRAAHGQAGRAARVATQDRGRRRVGAENVFTSRDLRILVDETAQPVASSDPDDVAGRHEGDPCRRVVSGRGSGAGGGWLVMDVFAEDVVEMSPAGDEDAVGALAAAVAIQRSQTAFARGAWTDVVIICVPVAVKTASNASVYLASRSLIRNFKPPVRSPKSMRVFGACWTVHSAVRSAVTPTR